MVLLIEKRNAYEEDTYLAFIDLQKTYDFISSVKLWYVLEQFELDRCLNNTINELYINNTAHVKRGNKLSQVFFPSKSLERDASVSSSV